MTRNGKGDNVSCFLWEKKLLLHKGEKQKLLHFQNKVSKDRDHKQRVQGRIYKHMTHKMAQETTSAASYGEILLLHKDEKQKLLHCQKGAKNDRNKVNTTRLTPRLQRCDPKKAKETTSDASFGEILLLHKGEKQKLLHFQNKVSKERDYKLRVQCRIYKHVTHKWHRRQQLLLPLGKNYCSIKARIRNSFTSNKELVETETTSNEFKTENTNI